MGLGALVLAAGAGERFGGPKQVAQLDGVSLVARATRLALPLCPAGIVVVTGAHAEDVGAALSGLAARIAFNPDWRSGIAGSLRRGIQALPTGVSACLVMLCDQAAVDGEDLERLIAAWVAAPDRVAAARYAGGLGAPAIFPAAFWPELCVLGGDRGARTLIASLAGVSAVEMPHAAHDVDTRGDLEAMRGAGLPRPEVPVYRDQPGRTGPEHRMTSIRVEYFAILREYAGRGSEEVETSARTAGELYRELAGRYRFPGLASVKVAINDEFREWNASLAEGDCVVFIPPVAGG